jgi:hypothetical protein
MSEGLEQRLFARWFPEPAVKSQSAVTVHSVPDRKTHSAHISAYAIKRI